VGTDAVASGAAGGVGGAQALVTRTPSASAKPCAIVLQIEPHKYAVAVWRRDEDGEAVYENVHRNIRDARLAARSVATGSNGDRRHALCSDPR
jgi:hypothetical protein